MAGSLREIKAKIASIKQTSHITGAMQMVSASKLTRSEQAAKDFQIYASKIRQITTDLLHSELVNGSSNPMLDARPVRKSGYIVITSDKGLVGGYNSTILKAVLDMIKRDHDSEDEYAIISIGGTGSDFFKARNMNVAFELRGLEDQPSFEQVGKIISKAVGMYQNELFDELYVCYNHHINSLSREVRVEKMLPIAAVPRNPDKDPVPGGPGWHRRPPSLHNDRQAGCPDASVSAAHSQPSPWLPGSWLRARPCGRRPSSPRRSRCRSARWCRTAPGRS